MNKKNIFIKLTIALIFSIFTIGLFFFFIRVIKNKNLHISNALFTLHEKENQAKNALVLKQRLKEVENIQNDINSHLVDRKKPDTFVFFLENLGTIGSTKVDVKTIDISKKDKNIMNVSIAIEGDFSSVMQTIALLESSPYRIEIQSVNFDSKRVTNTIEKNETTTATTTTTTSWNAGLSFTILINE